MRILIAVTLVCIFSLPAAFTQAVQDEAVDKELRLGVFPRRSAQATQKFFRPLADELSAKLGVRVVLETTHDFVSFWDNVVNQRYDIVHYNQYHYLKSHKQSGYRVFAQNVEFSHTTIAGALLVRRDSGINSVADLKGKTIVFGGGRGAMLAYITATHLLRQAGLKQGDYFEQFALNPPKACIATYYRKAVAAGAGNYVLELPQIKKKINVDEMKYLAVSKKMAHLPWAVKNTISDDLQKNIQTIMVDLYRTESGKKILKAAKITKFMPANDKDYNTHRDIVKIVLDEDL